MVMRMCGTIPENSLRIRPISSKVCKRAYESSILIWKSTIDFKHEWHLYNYMIENHTYTFFQ